MLEAKHDTWGHHGWIHRLVSSASSCQLQTSDTEPLYGNRIIAFGAIEYRCYGEVKRGINEKQSEYMAAVDQPSKPNMRE
jgi:hypothetical protein